MTHVYLKLTDGGNGQEAELHSCTLIVKRADFKECETVQFGRYVPTFYSMLQSVPGIHPAATDAVIWPFT
jgi:hypothetical protein